MEKKKSSRKWLVIVILPLFLVVVAVGCVLLLGGDRNNDDTLSNTTGTSQSGVSNPGVSEPDVTEPDVSQPDVTEPDVSVPGPSEPDPSEPDVSVPDPSEPDASQPGDVEQRPEEDDPDAQKCAHTYGPWVIVREADCATAGTKSQTCSSCGDTKQQTINAIGHSYSSWKTTKAATCELSGTKESTCANCGNTKTEVIAATGHKWDNGKDTVISTDCKIPSEKLYTCTACGKTKTEQTASHTFGEWQYEDAIFDWTHREGIGVLVTRPMPTHKKFHVCSKCSYKEYADIEDHVCCIDYYMDGDFTTATVREGTCSVPKIIRYTCEICGWWDDYVFKYTDFNLHEIVAEEILISEWGDYSNERYMEKFTCELCDYLSYSHIYSKTPSPYETINFESCKYRFSMYNLVGDPFDETEYILAHPEVQQVYRDPVYDANGDLLQFSFRMTLENGKQYDFTIYIDEVEKLIDDFRGFERDDGYTLDGVDKTRLGFMLIVDYIYSGKAWVYGYSWSG